MIGRNDAKCPSTSNTDAEAARQLDRRQRGRQRNAEIEHLTVDHGDAVAGLLELRRAHLRVELIEDRHLHTAGDQRKRRLAEDRGERVLRAERFVRHVDERTDREHRLGLRRRRRRRQRDEREARSDEARAHRLTPIPRSTARASINPKPNESSRPGAPRSIAYFSITASIAAGDVMPCCIIIAATPATCGAAIEVPIYPTVANTSKRGAV